MPRNSDMLLALDQSLVNLSIDYHRKMGTPPKKKDALFDPWQNRDFKRFVDTIKQLNDPLVTDIVFFLMTIPQDVVDNIMKYINMVNSPSQERWQ